MAGCMACGRPEGCSMCRGKKSGTRGAPSSSSGTFKRLSELKWQGLKLRDATVELTCGACGHDYTVPKPFVRSYLSEMAPGAALRRFNNPGARAAQERAQSNLRCSRCGSIDPGVWVAR
jgi:hypothetical protein